MAEQPGSGRLDPEILAAYVDGRLPPEDRARVEAEIAADPETQEWLVNTIRAVEDVDSVPEPRVQTPTVVLPFYRRRRVLGGVGVVLATAAALLLVVRVQPAWWQQLWGPAVDPRFAKLVAAVGEERYVEGRLSGGFKYGPLRSVTRGPGDLSNQNLALLAAAGELQKAAQEDPSAENLHAWGVAQLLLGEYNPAVSQLEEAAAEAPASAFIQSNLAAAYLARAQALSRPEDFPRALAASERAIHLQPDLLPGWFNRALALHGMFLGEQARAAWRDYLERDGDARSGWARYAREKLEERPESRSPSHELELRTDLDPEAWLNRGPLADFALALQQNDVQRAERALQELSVVAGTLAQRGDLFGRDLVASLRGAPASRLASIVASIMLLRQAVTASRSDQFERAASLATEASRADEGERSPLQYLGLSYELTNQFFGGRLDAVEDRATRLLPEVTARGYLRLRAQLLGRLGVIRYSLGDYDSARRLHSEAIEVWSALGEQPAIATARVNLAECYRALGDTDFAWREYVLALGARSQVRNATRRHTMLTSSALGALNQQMPEVAWHLAKQAQSEAQTAAVHGFLTESGYLMARAAADLGDHDRAVQALELAKSAYQHILDPGLRNRMGAELFRSSSLVLLESDPGSALTDAVESHRLYRTLGTTHRDAALYLTQARALRALGRAVEAESVLSSAIDAVEQQAAYVGSTTQRVTFLEDVWDPFSEMVELLLERSDQVKGLQYLDRGLRLSGGTSALNLKELDIPSDATLVIYMALRDRLLIWIVLSGRSPELVEVPVRRSVLESQVSRFALLASRRGTAVGTHVAAGVLAQSLVHPIVSRLPASGTLLIVADPIIQRVAFSLLPLDLAARELLIDRFATALCPSVSDCQLARATPWLSRSSVAHALVAGGQPDDSDRLMMAEREVNAVRDLYANALMGPATAQSLRTALEEADVVHYAGHAYLDVERPWMSSILLEVDGGQARARIAELVPERVRARVVVLGACQTMAGRPVRGQGVVGLAAELLRAGIGGVVATYWKIDDGAAAPLLVDVQRGLATGLPPWHAVRQAQLRIRRSGSSSVEWAAVVAVASAR